MAFATIASSTIPTAMNMIDNRIIRREDKLEALAKEQGEGGPEETPPR